MNFDDLLAKADKNARKLNRKVNEAAAELDHEKRRRKEQIVLDKQKEKERIKRALPPPPPKPKFVIPKKNAADKPNVDLRQIEAYKQRKEEEQRKKEKEDVKKKEELIRLRLEANGGKANKKIAKHFGKTPVELQMRYAHNPDHLEELHKRTQREEEEHDKLSDMYRQGVYKAINHKRTVDAKLTPTKTPSTTAKPSSSRNGGQSSGVSSSKHHQPIAASERKVVPSMTSKRPLTSSSSDRNAIERKRKAAPSAPAIDFASLMKTAERNRELTPDRIARRRSVTPPPTKRKSTEDCGVSAGRDLSGWSRKPQEDRSTKRDEYSSQRGRDGSNGKPLSSKEASKSLPAPTKKHPTPYGAANTKKREEDRPSGSGFKKPQERPAQATSSKRDTSSKSQPLQLPREGTPERSGLQVGKRYLPGDIRFKGQSQVSVPPPKASRPVSTPAPSSNRKPLPAPANSQKKPSKASHGELDPEIRRKLERLEQLERERAEEESNKRREQERKERERAHRKREDEDDNIARIKQRERMRYEQMRDRGGYAQRQSRGYNRDLSDSEDEEELEDEDDSDLADFIDDTEIDDLQRADFEESLRLINPRYNKEKWKMREKMIDERRMDARFRDVEQEERRSAKFALMEDIMEAKRGSKGL
jgi:hypothetical protein